MTTIYRNGSIYKHEGNKLEREFNDNNNEKKTQYVIRRKKIRRNKPKGLNIAAILEAMESQ